MLGINSKTLQSIVNNTEDRRPKKERRYDRNNRRDQKNDSSKEETALDRIMNEIDATYDADNTDEVEDNTDNNSETDDEIENNTIDDFEGDTMAIIPVNDSDEENNTDDDNEDIILENPRYHIDSIGRLVIRDDIVGTIPFSTSMDADYDLNIDNDTLGVLCTLSLMHIETSLTPDVICSPEEMIEYLSCEGIEKFDTSSFILMNLNNEFINNLPAYGYHVGIDKYKEWNDCIDFLLESGKTNNEIITILLNIVNYYEDRNFSSILSDSEWKIFKEKLSTEENKQKFFNIMVNDDESVLTSDELSPDEYSDDIFVENGTFIGEIRELLEIDESEGVDHDHNPFPEASDSEKEEGGNTIGRHGESIDASEEEREEKTEDEKEEEKSDDDWQEGNSEIDESEIEKEIEGFLKEEENAEILN